MPETEPLTCRACGRPVRRVVYVLVAGQGDAGPYGRACARRVVTDLLNAGVMSERRYARA